MNKIKATLSTFAVEHPYLRRLLEGALAYGAASAFQAAATSLGAQPPSGTDAATTAILVGVLLVLSRHLRVVATSDLGTK